MLGTFTWRGERHLTALAYEEVAVTSGQSGFNTTFVRMAELGFVVIVGGPLRALWFPGCSATLTGDFGVTFYDNQNTTMTKFEMTYWLATLATSVGAPPQSISPTAAIVQVHYYW